MDTNFYPHYKTFLSNLHRELLIYLYIIIIQIKIRKILSYGLVGETLLIILGQFFQTVISLGDFNRLFQMDLSA